MPFVTHTATGGVGGAIWTNRPASYTVGFVGSVAATSRGFWSNAAMRASVVAVGRSRIIVVPQEEAAPEPDQIPDRLQNHVYSAPTAHVFDMDLFNTWSAPRETPDTKPIPYQVFPAVEDSRRGSRFIQSRWGGPAGGDPVVSTRIIPHQIVPTPDRPAFFAATVSWKAPQDTQTRIIPFQMFTVPSDQRPWARFVAQRWGGPAADAPIVAPATIQTRLLLGVGL